MAIRDDFSVSSDGSIRYVGVGENYTVIQLHRWLGDLMDDAQAAGNDILDITDATASERSTDNIVTLKTPYNIDDEASKHLYDGSVIQDNGNTIYDGILVFANVGAYLYVFQNGSVLSPNFWTIGLNADATNGISHRFMIKVRSGGTDIDGRRLIGITREFGSTYSEFKINGTSRGNNVMALTYATDLNNQTAEATVNGYITITNTEGYRGLDVDNNTVNEYYYSEWNKATYTINQFYEREKWLSRRGTAESAYTDSSAANFAVGNATITGQAQSFVNGSNGVYLTRAFTRLRKVGSPTGNIVAKLYTHSGTYGTSSVPTGGALSTSNNIDVSKLTTIYQEVEFGFYTQYLMTASTNYVVAFEYSAGNGSNYVQVGGVTTSGHGGNRSENTGAWAATATDDLNFQVYASPKLYGISGEKFRGITHELGLTTPRSGDFNATELVSWGSDSTGVMVAIDSSNSGTKMWIQLLRGTAPSSHLLTGSTSGATATHSGTTTERTLSFPFCGASTGSAIIGSYGFGIETNDLSASDKLFDLTNTQRTPPNNVTFTVGGLVIGEDRLLVTWNDGGNIDENQFTLDATYSGGTVTSIQVSPAIPSDTASTGTIRVQCNSGIYKRISYTSWTGDIFTIESTNFSGDNANSGNNCYVSYIDKLVEATSEAFTVVYSTDRSLYIRVRDGGVTPIKTFETTGSLGSAGGSATAIRTADV